MTQKKLSRIMEGYLASAQVPSEPPIRAREPEPVILPTERWVLEDRKRLRKTYKFDAVGQRNLFVSLLLGMENESGHSGELSITKDSVKIVLGSFEDPITDLDKEYAKSADLIYRDVVCPMPKVYPFNTVG